MYEYFIKNGQLHTKMFPYKNLEKLQFLSFLVPGLNPRDDDFVSKTAEMYKKSESDEPFSETQILTRLEIKQVLRQMVRIQKKGKKKLAPEAVSKQLAP